MPERDEALDLYLQDLRRSAQLSVQQICERTKIQPRFVEALEAGRYGEVPSNTHLRAFSLSIAQVCGGDPERTVALVRRVLAATAPTGPAARGFDTPAPAPTEARKPLDAPEAPQVDTPRASAGERPRLAANGPAMSVSEPDRGLMGVSARLRSLPFGLLLALLALTGALSYGTSWGLEQWRSNRALRAVLMPDDPGELSADASPPSAAGKAAAPAPAKAAVAGTVEMAGVETAPIATLELALRARRDCWLVLEIDGERLATVTMRDGERLRWPVKERARLLAGNVGALRVWWQGDNWGYLGELGVRANALVFERGKRPRYDKTQALALPVGVPE